MTCLLLCSSEGISPVTLMVRDSLRKVVQLKRTKCCFYTRILSRKNRCGSRVVDDTSSRAHLNMHGDWKTHLFRNMSDKLYSRDYVRNFTLSSSLLFFQWTSLPVCYTGLSNLRKYNIYPIHNAAGEARRGGVTILPSITIVLAPLLRIDMLCSFAKHVCTLRSSRELRNSQARSRPTH